MSKTDSQSSQQERLISIAISPGELVDKVTILEIKAERVSDEGKLRHIHVELDLLRPIMEAEVLKSDKLLHLADELKQLNKALWDIEDSVRACEREKNFGERFIELVRSVYRTNDRRAGLKRQINDLLGSRIVEEKNYEPY